MAREIIGVGLAPGDNLGDGGRTGGIKINNNFKELFFIGFVKDGFNISRTHYNSDDETPTNYKVDDVVKGWADPDDKTRWVEGVILDATIELPADIDDADKFFITNEKFKL